MDLFDTSSGTIRALATTSTVHHNISSPFVSFWSLLVYFTSVITALILDMSHNKSRYVLCIQLV